MATIPCVWRLTTAHGTAAGKPQGSSCPGITATKGLGTHRRIQPSRLPSYGAIKRQPHLRGRVTLRVYPAYVIGSTIYDKHSGVARTNCPHSVPGLVADERYITVLLDRSPRRHTNCPPSGSRKLPSF